MDKLSVQLKSPKHGFQDKAKGNKKKGRSPIKVVYISNPMMVTTTASEFKDRVQELTGRYSNVFDASTPEQREEESPAAAAAPRTKPADMAPPAAAVDNSSTSTASSSAMSDPSGQFLDQAAGGAVEPCTPLDSNLDDFSSSYPYMGYDCFADLCYEPPPADELNYDRSVFW